MKKKLVLAILCLVVSFCTIACGGSSQKTWADDYVIAFSDEVLKNFPNLSDVDIRTNDGEIDISSLSDLEDYLEEE